MLIVVAPELELVALQAHHAPRLWEIIDRDRDYLRQWQNWPDYMRSYDDVLGLVQRAEEKRTSNNGFDLVIRYQNEVVGKIGLVYVNRRYSKTEIGYWLAKDQQGKGIVTRACHAVTDYALTPMRLRTVHIRVAVENTRSRAIPERLGFLNEGVIPHKTWLHGRPIEEVLYAMTTERWQQRKVSQESRNA